MPNCIYCQEERLQEDVCSVCNACTYSACCDCWQCSRCSVSYTNQIDNSCNNCSYCNNCCQCRECSSCDVLSIRVHNSCNRCDNCCECGEEDPARGISFIPPPRQLVFHTANKEFKHNPSQRYISTEIEVAEVAVKDNDKLTPVIQKWKGAVVQDGSLPSTGFEINTAPASGDKFVLQLKEIADALSDMRASVTNSCGLHVHVDARDFTFYDLRKLVFLYEKVEPALFGMLPKSRYSSQYCRPCGSKLVKDLEQNIVPKDNKKTLVKNVYDRADADLIRIANEKYNGSRYNALNVHSWVYRGTIEFRHHSGTTNFNKIKNWSILLASILDFAFENNERYIKNLKGDPLAILTSIAPDQEIKQFILDRHNHFSQNRSDNE